MSADIRRWAAEQVVRQHTEQAPLHEWKDPTSGKRVLLPYRATGRCPRCRTDGCEMRRWASGILDGST